MESTALKSDDRSELFLRFSRQRMIALLVVVVLLGASALALMISPTREIWRSASYAAIASVAIALIVVVALSLRRRQWSPTAREVTVVMQDEWRRTNMERASRAALITVLAVQYPFVMIFGFAMDLPAPRGAFAMAASTITLGLTTMIGLFLYFDRE
ncbi:MAG TPA: hypothetical protein VIL97_09100 [Thermoanaerobaculia bacterium]